MNQLEQMERLLLSNLSSALETEGEHSVVVRKARGLLSSFYRAAFPRVIMASLRSCSQLIFLRKGGNECAR